VKKNISITVTIIMLFIIVFFVGNEDYFGSSSQRIAQNGIVMIEEQELQENTILKLDGEWSFYPNILISSSESFDAYTSKKIPIEVPATWNSFVEPNEEGLTVGTYHVKINVPIEGEYGLYIRSIRQSNRVFINGEDVGSMGNPSETLKDFKFENDDKYTVFANSENQMLDIVIHVGNYNYPKAGITFPIEFGTKEAIQRDFSMKILADSFVCIGYIVFGAIYIISYSQNRKRKEELFLGLFTILFGLYMSFTNEKNIFPYFYIYNYK